MNQYAQVTCNVNCLFETEGLLKVTSSDLPCKSGYISETVKDRDVTTDH